MTFKTLRSIRHKPLNTGTCFECNETIEYSKIAGDIMILENHYTYLFHRACVTGILSAHIASIKDREHHSDERSTAADYACRTGQRPYIVPKDGD